jgi:1L-myo-inositol 1-phosphate cytidylyltransferase / CDP-L-myo-inositol myo-inositolphosphotransferase
VVLAAGLSSRMEPLSKGHSKGLVRLGGLTLIDRCLRTLEHVGLTEIIVIAGHDLEALQRHIRAGDRTGLRLIQAEDWQHGNGYSLAAAEPFVDPQEPFVLVTVDHVFSLASLEDLVLAEPPAALIDVAPSPAEWLEGTKALLDGGRVLGFGKELDSAAIDCGAFLLGVQIFDAHRAASMRGDTSLAGALSEVASVQAMNAVIVDPDTWTDVDTPNDLSHARTRLRRSLGKDSDGPISRFLNRPVSTRISMAVAHLPVSADLLSIAVAVMALVAGLLLAAGHGIAGGMAVHAVSVLDGVDGELSRLRMRATPRGALLDGILDRISDAAIIGGMGAWAVASAPVVPTVWLITVALAGSMLSMASKDRAKLLGLPAAPEDWTGWLMGGRDGRLLLITIAAIAGLPLVGLLAIATTSVLSLGIRLTFVMRSHGQASDRRTEEWSPPRA